MLTDLIFPESLIKDITDRTNRYIWARVNDPGCKLDKYNEVAEDEILHFIPIYYYSGIVKVPARRDYWKRGATWPTHWIHGVMGRDRFDYIWRHIHLSNALDEIGKDKVVVDDEVVLPEQDEDRQFEEYDSGDDGGGTDDTPIEETLWYEKAELLLDFVNDISKKMCKFPGTCVAIDEMMKLFKGRSGMAQRMKKKPIKEGCKFYALCDSGTGYCWHLIPDGRADPAKDSIAGSVLKLIQALPNKNHPNRNHKKFYCAAMDNYFTTSKVMVACRNEGVGAFGTARARAGWPPEELSKITDERLNTAYMMNDQDNYRIFRWYDNNIVKMVSNVHYGLEGDHIPRFRKRPRQNQANRKNIKAAWGDSCEAEIKIPQVIEDYNRIMNGVGMCDQYISNYRTKFRCQRNWMPIMFHLLDVLQVNSFIVYDGIKSRTDQEYARQSGRHKTFAMGLADALCARAARAKSNARASSRMKRRPSPAEQKSKKKRSVNRPRRRFCGPSPGNQLNPMRLHVNNLHHHAVRKDEAERTNCSWCAYLQAKCKADGKDYFLPRRTNMYCTYCKDTLCKDCWSDFHNETDV